MIHCWCLWSIIQCRIFTSNNPETIDGLNTWQMSMKKITQYQYSKNPANKFRNLLNDCGFTECDVKVHEKYFTFNGVEIVRSKIWSIFFYFFFVFKPIFLQWNLQIFPHSDSLHSKNPFIDRIPALDWQARILMIL